MKRVLKLTTNVNNEIACITSALGCASAEHGGGGGGERKRSSLASMPRAPRSHTIKASCAKQVYRKRVSLKHVYSNMFEC